MHAAVLRRMLSQEPTSRCLLRFYDVLLVSDSTSKIAMSHATVELKLSARVTPTIQSPLRLKVRDNDKRCNVQFIVVPYSLLDSSF